MLRTIAVSMVTGLSLAGPVRPGRVVHTATDPVKFTVRVENISTDALKLSTGGTAPAPTAPILWAVHTTSNPLFDAGKRDRGLGLEHLAEDGDPSGLAAALQDKTGIASVGVVNIPVGDAMAGPITPGKAYEFTVSAKPGQRLTLAFMFGQSNDLFYAPGGTGIALFDTAGNPRSGDITRYFQLWDAGTEVNQEPGVGPDQAPRQKMANSGAAEAKPVGRVDDGWVYPKTAQVIRVTLTPTAM